MLLLQSLLHTFEIFSNYLAEKKKNTDDFNVMIWLHKNDFFHFKNSLQFFFAC